METLKIAVFGAGGMLGQDLCERIPSPFKLLDYKRDVDITSLAQVREVCERDKPAWIINAVAYNNVDGAEIHAEQARLVNVVGPENLATLGAQQGIPLIHVSTDYVFSGKKDGLYSEEDETNPVSQYAKTKNEGEEVVRKIPRHYILRTSTLFGKARKNHATWVLQATKDKKPVPLATDLICSPTYTGDLADWIFQLIKKKPPYGTYHSVHKDYCSRFEFAEALCQRVGCAKPYPLRSVLIGDLNFKAHRPLRVCLSTEKWEKSMGPLPSWKEGLERFLREVKVQVV